MYTLKGENKENHTQLEMQKRKRKLSIEDEKTIKMWILDYEKNFVSQTSLVPLEYNLESNSENLWCENSKLHSQISVDYNNSNDKRQFFCCDSQGCITNALNEISSDIDIHLSSFSQNYVNNESSKQIMSSLKVETQNLEYEFDFQSDTKNSTISFEMDPSKINIFQDETSFSNVFTNINEIDNMSFLMSNHSCEYEYEIMKDISMPKNRKMEIELEYFDPFMKLKSSEIRINVIRAIRILDETISASDI